MALVLAPFVMVGLFLAQYIFLPLSLLIMSKLNIDMDDVFDDDSDSLTGFVYKMVVGIIYLVTSIGMIYIAYTWGINFFLGEFTQMFKEDFLSMSILTILVIFVAGITVKLINMGIYSIAASSEKKKDHIEAIDEAPMWTDNLISIESSFKENVIKYCNAFQEKNYEKVASYFFQEKIMAHGGMDSTIFMLESTTATVTFDSWDLGKVQVMHDHSDIYIGVAEVTYEIDRRENGNIYKLKNETGLIGHTDNKGATWHYIGVTQEERSLLLNMLPELFQAFDIPEEKLFIKNNGNWDPIN